MRNSAGTYHFDVILHGIGFGVVEPRGIIELVARIVGADFD